ncbi:hypothetical protein C8Q77DRAFT_1088994 [Trametes polyzona]|nr:hypothetical protein C8Q77DRAFT_1088994 [Trametes polyzona]
MSFPGQDTGMSTTSAILSGTSTVMVAFSSSAAAKSHGEATFVRHKQANVEHVWYGVLGLLGLATLVNALFLFWSILHRYRYRHAHCTRAPLQPSGRVALRRLPQAILSGFRILGYRLRIPHVDMTILELGLTILYLGGCLVWSFVPEDNILPRTNLKPEYWGGNTAKLAAAQLPLVVVLALKNNPITWFTGIGHEKLVPLHRIVSRCIFVLTWLHLVGAYYRSPSRFLNEGWKVAGLVAAVAQTVTTIFGIKPIRRRYYETFYSTHVLLILVFLICAHIHCIPVNFDKYVWSVWIIWGFDRLLRAGRYLLSTIILRPKNPNALIECIGGDGLRVRLKRDIPGGWKAGQHAFLAFPKLGIESHPFTIGSVYEKEQGGREAELVFIVRAMGGQTRMLMDLAAPSGSCELAALVDGPYGHPEDIRAFSTCVFIAGGTGVTYTLARMHQLLRDVLASNACAKRVVFVWAVRTEAESEWILADLSKIVALAPPSISLSVEISITAARSTSATASLPTLGKGYDLEKALARTSVSHADHRVSPTLVRKEQGDECDDEKTDESFPNSQASSGTCTPTKSDEDCFGSGATTPTVCAEGASPSLRKGITRRSGRPDVRTILGEEVTASEGAVAVDVSGPDGLVNAVRSALCQPFAGPTATLRGAPTVMLNVEQFRM